MARRRIRLVPLLALAAALAVAAGAYASLRLVAAQGIVPPRRQACAVATRKEAAPSPVRLGETVGVTLTVAVTCPARARELDLVLLLDSSGTMAGAPLERMKAGAVDLVRGLDLPANPGVEVGVVEFNTVTRIRTALTNQESRVIGAIQGIRSRGGTRIDAGLIAALRVLFSGRTLPADACRPRVIALVTDGNDNAGCQPALQIATQIRGQGVTLVAVCVGATCDAACMRGIASQPYHDHHAATPDDLAGVYARIGDELRLLVGRDIASLLVTDVLGDDVTYVADSAAPTTEIRTARALTWTLPAPYGVTLTLRVRPTRAGRVATNRSASGILRGCERPEMPFTFTIPVVDVIGPATDTPVPTATPTRTVTPTPDTRTPVTPTPPVTPTTGPTPTTDTRTPATPASPVTPTQGVTPGTVTPATPSPSPSTTAAPTATPRPVELYLPYAVHAWPHVSGVDVVLVVDTSASMLEPIAPGAAIKADTARSALAASLDRLMPAMGTTVAVVTFDASARLALASSADRASVRRALDALAAGPTGSRLDLGIREGWRALGGALRPGRVAVIVVLTDGRASPATALVAAVEAQTARAGGAEIFAVGLGGDVDVVALRECAGSPDRAHVAGSEAAAGAAVGAIAREIERLRWR